jgi:hypothetical protein
MITKHTFGYLVNGTVPAHLVDTLAEVGTVHKTVYILHFENPLGHERTKAQLAEWDRPARQQPYTPHAQHYVGYTTKEVEERLSEHLSGSGCPLVYKAGQSGEVVVARIFHAGYLFERHLKNRYKKTPDLCPICNPLAARHFAEVPGELYGPT